MEDATSGSSREAASEDNVTTCTVLYRIVLYCTVLYEVEASIKDAKKMAISRLFLDARARV
jgi:hypothetical protein